MYSSDDKSNFEKRIEIKELIKISEINYFEKKIKLSPLSFRKPYPDRKINSVYFDNNKYESLSESIDGNSVRYKKRIRWYGINNYQDNVALEIKKKKGHLSWKKILKINKPVNIIAETWGNFFVNNWLENSRNKILLNLKPVSIVTYDRSYYCSFDNKVRITVDRNLKTFDQTISKSPNLFKNRSTPKIVVIEIKVSNKDSVLIHNTLKNLPFTAKRFSKYCESLIPQYSNKY